MITADGFSSGDAILCRSISGIRLLTSRRGCSCIGVRKAANGGAKVEGWAWLGLGCMRCSCACSAHSC